MAGLFGYRIIRRVEVGWWVPKWRMRAEGTTAARLAVGGRRVSFSLSSVFVIFFSVVDRREVWATELCGGREARWE